MRTRARSAVSRQRSAVSGQPSAANFVAQASTPMLFTSCSFA
ncbi:hypothetical protein [Moorena sp. SIO4G3]|nr:hypothetical protein [Moorena sp. SIO4G3]